MAPRFEPHPLAAYGWAPGDYGFMCQDCKSDKVGNGAKRSFRCQSCAQALYDAAQGSQKKKLTGGLVNYYLVRVKHPQRVEQPAYQAECEDIIQALNLDFNEGCIFKAIWRSAAARMGNPKPDHKMLYDAEKIVHYAQRNLNRVKRSGSS